MSSELKKVKQTVFCSIKEETVSIVKNLTSGSQIFITFSHFQDIAGKKVNIPNYFIKGLTKLIKDESVEEYIFNSEVSFQYLRKYEYNEKRERKRTGNQYILIETPSNRKILVNQNEIGYLITELTKVK